VRIAADLMFERGAAATSIDDVKRAAKVSASQVGYYFGDKQSLVRAVIEYQADTLFEGQRPLLDRLDSFEALHAWRDHIVAMRVERRYIGGCPVGSLASELADSSPALREGHRRRVPALARTDHSGPDSHAHPRRPTPRSRPGSTLDGTPGCGRGRHPARPTLRQVAHWRQSSTPCSPTSARWLECPIRTVGDLPRWWPEGEDRLGFRIAKPGEVWIRTPSGVVQPQEPAKSVNPAVRS